MGKSKKKYIKFKEKHLSFSEGQILNVGYKAANKLLADKLVVEATEKQYSDYIKKIAQAKAKAKAEKLAEAKAEKESEKSECKDCEGKKEPCKDCEENQAE